MKIGIVTLVGYFNYGNRLQNYALQKVLQEMGCEVETLSVDKDVNCLKRLVKRLVKLDDGHYSISKNEIIRENNFRKFTKKFIRTKYYHTIDGKLKSKINDKYDFFIVGSDQVWNPSFWETGEGSPEYYNYMLHFAVPQKRIAYAASVGLESIPNGWKTQFKTGFDGFFKISVREKEAAKIVYELTEKRVQTVVDPTMLISDIEWRKIAKSHKENVDGKKYLLTCFLGQESENVSKYINDIANKYDLEVVELMNKKLENIYKVGPESFLALIDSAQLVITDSFHASVFSIIFKSPFIVVDRVYKNGMNMNGRIKTLLNTFNMNKRYGLLEERDVFNCDFSNVDSILKYQRECSLEFLRNAISL